MTRETAKPGHTLRFGIALTHLLGPSPSAQDIIQCARAAEDAGFNSIIVSDHVLTLDFDEASYPAGSFPPSVYWFDPFVLLAAIAGATTTILLETGIAVLPYRPPIQQAQAVATLDFMSGGRFRYGVGLGWMQEEFEALDVPFAERGRRVDEHLEVMKLLWSGSDAGFHGEFTDFARGRLHPMPAQRPHPPILIGGESPAALRRIIRHGNGFYINWKTLPEFTRLVDELEVGMRAAGRDLLALHMQLASTDVEQVRAERANLNTYEERGLREIVFAPAADSVRDGLRMLGEIADEFLGAAIARPVTSEGYLST